MTSAPAGRLQPQQLALVGQQVEQSARSLLHVAHPLAQSHIEVEMARLMTQKAAALYDAGDDMAAGEAANMAKYAAAEAACDAADRAVQTHGGNGITQEYGMAGLLVANALRRGSWPGVLPVAVFVAVIDRFQIAAEERALADRFGVDYAAYRSSVPRWLGARSFSR